MGHYLPPGPDCWEDAHLAFVAPGDLKHIPANTISVFNVSRLLELQHCEQSFDLEYVQNRRPKHIGTPLVLGTIVHEAIRTLHRTWPPGEQEVQDVLGEWGAQLVDRLVENDEDPDEPLAWLERILPMYVGKYSAEPLWDRVLSVESPLLMMVSSPRGEFLLTGRPDAVVVRHGKLWHLQRKTLNPRKGIDRFIEEQRMSVHECVYGEMINLAAKAGWFGTDVKNLEYAGTQFDVLIKKAFPKPPVNTTKDGRITEAFQARLDKYEFEKTGYLEQVLQRREVAYAPGFRQEVIGELGYLIDQMYLPRLSRPRKSFGACVRYNRPCVWHRVCRGEDRLEGPSFIRRTPDYVDELEGR